MERFWQNAGVRNWSLCLLASLGLHSLLLGGFLLFGPERPKPKKVVAVEAVCLVPGTGPLGGKSGGAGPELHPAPPKPAPKPASPPKIKPKPPKRKKARQVAPPPEPTPIPERLAMARPAPAPRPRSITTTAPAAAGPRRGRTAASGGAGSGTGSGRGSGKGLGSGSGRGSGQGQGSGSGNLLAGYLASVRQLLEKHKRYPGEARRRWQEGVVVLSFTINRNGEISHPRVSRSSGHRILDDAARDTLTRLHRFPPFPAQIHRSQLAIQVPLAFRLREG